MESKQSSGLLYELYLRETARVILFSDAVIGLPEWPCRTVQWLVRSVSVFEYVFGVVFYAIFHWICVCRITNKVSAVQNITRNMNISEAQHWSRWSYVQFSM